VKRTYVQNVMPITFRVLFAIDLFETVFETISYKRYYLLL